MPDQVAQNLGRAGNGRTHRLQHLRHAGRIDPVGDFQGRELCVFHDCREQVAKHQIGF